jgi:hypothetical protein
MARFLYKLKYPMDQALEMYASILSMEDASVDIQYYVQCKVIGIFCKLFQRGELSQTMWNYLGKIQPMETSPSTQHQAFEHMLSILHRIQANDKKRWHHKATYRVHLSLLHESV